MRPLLALSSDPGSCHIPVAHGGGGRTDIWEVEEVAHCIWRPQQSRPCQGRQPHVPTVYNGLKAIRGQQGLFPLRRMDGKGEGGPLGLKLLRCCH